MLNSVSQLAIRKVKPDTNMYQTKLPHEINIERYDYQEEYKSSRSSDSIHGSQNVSTYKIRFK